jgi:hypothetical protein
MRDKRRCSRTPVEIPVEFTPWDPKHVAFGFVTDLTLTGAAVSTEFPLPRGSHVVMRMWRPSWDQETVITGVVRWARGRRMGVQLAPMPAATCDRLKEQMVEEQMVASRPTSHLPTRNPRRTTHLGTLTRMLALVGVSACGGLGTAGLLTQAAGTDGGRALGGAQIGDGGAAPSYNDDASSGFELSPPVLVDADPASSPVDGSVDVHGDGAYVIPGRPSDASAADRADLDAETPCGALAQCCSRLIVAPPLAAACYVTAQSDGGAAGCGSTLATFKDSGLCP